MNEQDQPRNPFAVDEATRTAIILGRHGIELEWFDEPPRDMRTITILIDGERHTRTLSQRSDDFREFVYWWRQADVIASRDGDDARALLDRRLALTNLFPDLADDLAERLSTREPTR